MRDKDISKNLTEVLPNSIKKKRKGVLGVIKVMLNPKEFFRVTSCNLGVSHCDMNFHVCTMNKCVC